MKNKILKSLILFVIALPILQSANAQDNPKVIRLEYMVLPNGGVMSGLLDRGELIYNFADSAWHIRVKMPATLHSSSGKQYVRTAGLKKQVAIPYDDRALFCISPDEYNKLKSTGCIEFEGQYLSVVSTDYPQTYNADGKKLYAIVAENNTGSVRLWVLDNPFFPVILKTEGSSYNPDIELISLK